MTLAINCRIKYDTLMDNRNTYENVDLYNYGVNMVNSYNSPTRYPMHWHEVVEMAYLPLDADRSVPHIVNVLGNEVTLEPGDVAFFWPGQLHEITKNPDLKLVGLQYSLNLITEFLDFLPYLTAYRRINHLSHDAYPEVTEGIGGKILEIIQAHKDRGPFFGVEMIKRVYDIFILLARHLDESAAADTMNHSHSVDTLEKVNASCTYIREHLQEDLTLPMIAEQAGFSVPYFSRTFKSVMGMSFSSYVNYQRIRLAESLLSEGRLTTTDICYKSGFASIATFNRTFRKVTGSSPREFKNYHRI